MLDIDKIPIFILDDRKKKYDILFCNVEQFEKDHITLQVDSSKIYLIKVPKPHVFPGYFLNLFSDVYVLYPMLYEEIIDLKNIIFLRRMINLEDNQTICDKSKLEMPFKKSRLSITSPPQDQLVNSSTIVMNPSRSPIE